MKILIAIILFSGAFQAKAFEGRADDKSNNTVLGIFDDSTGEIADMDYSSIDEGGYASALSEKRTCIHTCKGISIPTKNGNLIVFQEFPAMSHAEKRAYIQECVQRCKGKFPS